MQCLQGASAVEQILGENGKLKLHGMIVWEPVLDSDWAPPITGTLGRIFDTRVAQFYDKGLLVSALAQPELMKDAAPLVGKESLVKGKIVWDYIAVYARGAAWHGKDMPAPSFKAAPVAEAEKQLREFLAGLQ